MITRLPTGQPGQALALAIGASLIAVLWFGAINPVAHLYQCRSTVILQRENLLHHMRGLDAMMPSLQSRIGDGTVTPTPISLLQGTSAILAGVELQHRIEELARAVGASPASTESLATDSAGSYHRIGLRVTLTVPWPVFVRFLVAIRQTTPLILVDDLTLSSSRIRGAPEGGVLNVRRHRGVSLERMIADLNPLLREWTGYFGFSQLYKLASLDGWTRRRLRCVVWLQCRTEGNRYRELCRLKVTEKVAGAAIFSPKGPWRLSSSGALHRAFTNRCFKGPTFEWWEFWAQATASTVWLGEPGEGKRCSAAVRLHEIRVVVAGPSATASARAATPKDPPKWLSV
jgi:Type II secretion system (T2SS), protein M subtype b/Group II intron, maturase-specific domain